MAPSERAGEICEHTHFIGLPVCVLKAREQQPVGAAVVPIA